MAKELHGILIAGSSHVGKSTLAKTLGNRLGWKTISTDDLARHPGRPWPEIRPQVAEYYSRLSDETIYWFIGVHHENMWPRLSQMISEETAKRYGYIFEGSALRPEFIAELASDEIFVLCLHADGDFLRDRIRNGSQYWQQDDKQKHLIDRFIERSLRDNDASWQMAQKLGLQTVDVTTAKDFEELVASIVSRVSTDRIN